MKTIRKNLLLLAFAAGAMFVIGNNVLAEGPGEGEREIKVLPEVTITCSKEGVPGAQCWERYSNTCRWTGSMLTTC